jgi:hypothetical protein
VTSVGGWQDTVCVLSVVIWHSLDTPEVKLLTLISLCTASQRLMFRVFSVTLKPHNAVIDMNILAVCRKATANCKSACRVFSVVD